MTPFFTSLLILLSALSSTVAFSPIPLKVVGTTTSTSLFAFQKKGKLPKYDAATQTWTKAPDDDGEYPYDAVGALLRHGPSAFIARLTNPDEYEQGILKYMAGTGVSRAEAVGNMDAKLNNAMDWMYQKQAEKRGAPKVDYTELKTKDAALTATWALFITPLVVNVIAKTVSQF